MNIERFFFLVVAGSAAAMIASCAGIAVWIAYRLIFNGGYV